VNPAESSPGNPPLTAEARRARDEKRAYLSLLVLGTIAFLLFGPIQCVVLQQDEQKGMAVAFGPVLLLALPFLVALLAAFIFSFLGFVAGGDSVRIRLLLWYGAAVVFFVQMVELDSRSGGGRFPPSTVWTFALLGFGSLLAVCVMPVWWLRSHRRRDAQRSKPGDA